MEGDLLSSTFSTTHPWWSTLRSPAKQQSPTGPAARARLLVLPHSGAGPTSLLPALGAVPGDVEVLGFCLPGRERRYDEPIGCTLAEALGSIHTEILQLEPLPTVVFGHSLGALLALRVAHLLPESCRSLVISGQVPGGALLPGTARTAEELLSVIEEGEGTSTRIIRDPVMRQRILEVLDADLRLGREVATLEEIRVTVPMQVLGGRSDRLVPVDGLASWARFTTGQCRIEPLDGGHFALLEPRNREKVAGVLRTAIPAPS